MSWQVLADDIPDTFDVIPYPFAGLKQTIEFPLRLIVTATDSWQATALQTRPTMQLLIDWKLGGFGDRSNMEALTTSDKKCIVPLQHLRSAATRPSPAVINYLKPDALSRLPLFDYICLNVGTLFLYKKVDSQDDTTIVVDPPISMAEHRALGSYPLVVHPCAVMERQDGATSITPHVDVPSGSSYSIKYGSPALSYDYSEDPDLTTNLQESSGRQITVGDKRIIVEDEEQQTIIASTLVKRRLRTVNVKSSFFVPDHEKLLRRLSYVYVTPGVNALHPILADGGKTIQVLVTRAEFQVGGVVANASLAATILIPANEITSP